MKKLNFGCGIKIKEGWDNVDIQKDKKLTKSFDFNKFPYPLKKNYYDYILIENILEHLDEPEKVLNELWKIAKRGGILEIIAPHYTNKGAYSDFQHKHFFNEICFSQLASQENKIEKKPKFEMIELKLTPTSFGKIFPEFIRKKLSLFINGLISQIHVKMKVLK